MSAACKMALRYHGGKWMLGAWIVDSLPEHRVYVEPFGGGASVLLRKPRAYAEIYSDLSDEVVSFFTVLRDDPAALERAVRLTPFSETELSRAYADPPSICDIEAARRLLVKSYMGHGSDSIGRLSGFRSDSNRSGSTPARDWSRWPDRIAALSARLQGVTIMCRDAIDVIHKFDGVDTLHYVDPPYLGTTRRSVGAYLNEYETAAQHQHLAATLHQVAGMVALSGYPSPLYDTLYSDWTVLTREAFADGAKPRIECLWLNPAAAHAHAAKTLPLFGDSL